MSAGPFSGGHIAVDEFAHHGHAETITVSDPYLLFSGDYKRSGPDLILSKDGREHVVENYFIGDKRAALAAPDGASLSGDVVSALTGHVQYAQASGAADAGKVIGHVTKLAGNATVIRNGVSIVLNMGDNVHKGDVVQSGSNSQLGITFIDGTVFGLASNARMVLNEMVYDPNGSSNSSFLTLVQGTITFLAGDTAKHGDMKIGTPVATMGIRGTACQVEIGFDVQVPNPNSTVPLSVPVKFRVLQEKDGTVGSYLLFAKDDLTYSNPIATINHAGQVTSFNANGQITITQLAQIAPEVKQVTDYVLGISSGNNPNNPITPGSGVTPDSATPKDTTPLKDIPVGTPTPLEVPINFQTPGQPGQITHETVNVTVTVLKKVDVAAVVDKSNFDIAKQVTITDSNPSDVLTPYVPGSGKIESATGPAYTPAGIDLKHFVAVDPSTGHVSYDPAGFAFLKAGDKAVVTIGFDARAGSDTFHESVTVTITGVNDAPAIGNATIAVSEGGTVVLTAANIGVTDPDNTSFAFKVANVTHGTFQTTVDGVTWVDAVAFTTADLAAGHVRFVHDGGEGAPTFSIEADDGEASNHLSATLAGTIDFTNVNDVPTITTALLSLSEGGRVVLDAASIGVTDPDNTSFTFTVSNVSHGAFQTTTDGTTWVDATAFTTADLAAGHVRFVHDGGEDAPTFSIQADDGESVNNLSNVLAGSVSFTNVNDAPVVTKAALDVLEGGTVVLDAASIGVADPDSTSFKFTVSNVSHGTFQTTADGNVWVDAATFTTGDLNAGHVRFVHDGGEDAPAFSITADDGAASNNLSAAVAGTVSFTNVNDAPVVTKAILDVQEGGTVVLDAAAIGVSDPDSPSFTFTVSNVSHGTFQVTTDDVTWTDTLTFTTEDLNTGHVRFVHDGGEDAPTFSIQAYDGADDNSLSNVFAGSVNFTIVNHAPVAVPDTGVSITENGGVAVSFSPILDASAGVGGEYVITQPSNDQVGALWSDSKISLNTSFTISADLFFGTKDFDGADGFSFIIQNESKSAIGAVGGGLGYQGIAHSIAIEFDTHDNGSGFNDIPDDHAAFDINGSMSGLGAPIDLGNIEDGQYHPVTISWNAATHLITLSYNGIVVGTQTIDIAATVGSDEAYIGFAGSTGALNNLQKIRDLSYQSADSSVVLDVLANDTDVDPGDKATLHVVSASSENGASLTFSGLAGAGIVYSPGHAFDYLAAGQTAIDTVTYTIADSHGAQSDPSTAQVTIVGLNDAPVIQGGDTRSVSVAENTTAVGMVVADDPDGPSLAYSIVGGLGSPDASSFTINSATGALSFIHAPDFENPADSNHNNIYTVQVKASDGSLSDIQTLFVHVTDVNEAPHAVNDTVITNNTNGSTYEIPDWALLANDTDPDGNALHLTAITASSEFASIDLTTNPGNVTIHDLFVGGSFTYRASDGSLSDTANVTVAQDTGTMNGGSGNEIFIGDSSGTTINANGGNDILIGNGGNDILNGGSGNDTYVFGLHDGHDVINDTSGLDTIRIEAGGAALSGLNFAENTTHDLVIQFNGQQVTVDDHFVGDDNVGGLLFDGGASYDGYSLDSDLYFLSNDGGSNRNGTTGNDILSGDGNANNISGGDGNDLLFGNAGNDTLNGGSGNDLLVGGAGNDFMTGGPGNDTFVFAQGSGHDTVADFTPGQDHISLDYHAFNSDGPNNFTSWLSSHTTIHGSDLLIDLNADGHHPGVDTILLKNVATLHAGDFIVHPVT
jgi:VCBS repeat-containing protein